MDNLNSSYSIGLDLGTSSAKGVLLSRNSEVVKEFSARFELYEASLHGGSKYIGIDTEKYYYTICKVIKKLAQAVPSMAIKGLAIVSASGNTLLCNRYGEPLIKAYSWLNEPMNQEVKTILGDIDREELAHISGWQFYSTFPLAHLSHVKVNEQELLKKAERVCMTTEYVLFKLTGKWGIDRSTATPSYLYNQLSEKWHMPFLSRLNIPVEKLPAIYDSGYQLGYISTDSSRDTGLAEGTKVFLGCFDHPAAARANGITKQGQLLISCGTSWVCFFPHNNRDMILQQKLLCDPFLSPNGEWGAMFSLPQIGKKIDSIISRYISNERNKFKRFDNLASQAKPDAIGLKINPMVDIEGDLSDYPQESIARATMEGTAYALKERLNALAECGISFKSALMAGGPSKSKVWLKTLSEILGIDIKVIFGEYSGAVGAAKFVPVHKQ